MKLVAEGMVFLEIDPEESDTQAMDRLSRIMEDSGLDCAVSEVYILDDKGKKVRVLV